jgi:excisionase family DNA binding protein
MNTAGLEKAEIVFDLPPRYISVIEAAKMLGVSGRSVYGYIEEKKLSGFKAGGHIVILRSEVLKFKRGTTGRPRTRVPEWRISENGNAQYMTQIFIQIREGQEEVLECKLDEIRKGNKHMFPGTVARYITHSQTDASDVQILLIWRGTVMPDVATREAALDDLRQELANVLDWKNAHIEMHEIMMHT